MKFKPEVDIKNFNNNKKGKLYVGDREGKI
jgi:hypothetical protein